MPLRQPYAPAPLGITVMPEWFACEGIEGVLDRVQKLGATAIATSPYVLEVAPDGEGAREPPLDAGAGSVRPLDRPLFGRRELWVRTAPAFVHATARYAGLRYQPSPSSDLTYRDADLLDRIVETCERRGIELYLQVMAASPPGYRVQFSAAVEEANKAAVRANEMAKENFGGSMPMFPGMVNAVGLVFPHSAAGKANVTIKTADGPKNYVADAHGEIKLRINPKLQAENPELVFSQRPDWIGIGHF